MKELIIKDELAGLEESKAKQIEAVFAPMVEMLKGFEKAYNEVVSMDVTEDTCKKAKRLRLDISKIRIDADKIRKVQKEEYTRGGNAVQGVYNILKFAVVDKEEKLKEIETHFERLEEEKKKTLQAEREIELNKYDFDGSTTALGNMDENVWKNFLSGTKLNYEAVKEAERKAEEERLAKIEADRIEQERIKKENEALKKEHEALKKEREAEKKKQDAILKKEREAKEKIEKELADKKAKEAVEAKNKADAEKKALEAGDSEKLKALLVHFDSLRGGKLKSEVAQTAIKEAYQILSTAINEIED